MITKEYYPGKPVNIHVQPLMNITQENNRVIIIKRGKGKVPLFFGNGEQVIPFYGIKRQCPYIYDVGSIEWLQHFTRPCIELLY